MTKTEAAWAAGVLEGEACFDFNASNPKYPRIRVEMADADVVHRLHALLGGRVTSVRKRNAKPNWATYTLLTINGRERVQGILREIHPWMGERRSKKIEELLKAE